MKTSNDATTRYDFSEYPLDHPLYDTIRYEKPSVSSRTSYSVPMEEFVALRPKCYAFKCTGKVDTNTLKHSRPVEKKTAKGVKRTAQDQHLHFQHFLDAFKNIHSFVCKQYLISSTSHTVRSVHQRKI